ncbi:MAG: DinB family protein [Chloracidobacterium sp.]|nr:DinB family protein [Chloracidobacterium sp.]
MRYTSIADIYSANRRIRSRLLDVLGEITDEEASAIPDGEKWSVRHIVEHLWMVEYGTARICERLLNAAKADGKPSDGSFGVGSQFGQRAAEVAVTRIEAPERVQPTGDVPIADSLEKMKETGVTLDAMQGDLESYDLSGHTFPHPFFGEINAGEWLVMAGLHERRHTEQIERVIGLIRQ